MATTARLCASCGSPLPEVPPGVRQAKCAFCGVVNDIAAAGAAPVTIAVNRTDAARAVGRIGTVIAAFIIISVVGALAAAGFGIYVATRAVSEATSAVSTGTSAARAIAGGLKRRSVAPGDLPKTGGGGWQTLEVPPPSSGWAAFEPVGDLNWAMAIAKAWQQDAQLMRIDVSRLTPQGIVNLTSTGEDSAMYRFESPSRIEEWKKVARQGESNPQIGHELMVKLSQQVITALVTQGKPSQYEKLPPAADSLPLAQLMSVARRKPAFAQPSFFDGYMINLEDEGWVWYLTGRGFDESLPRLRARDGAAFPYR